MSSGRLGTLWLVRSSCCTLFRRGRLGLVDWYKEGIREAAAGVAFLDSRKIIRFLLFGPGGIVDGVGRISGGGERD